MLSPFTVRPATEADLDPMTSITVAAYPLEQQWRYVFSYLDDYPNDHRDFLREQQKEHLANAWKGTHAVIVAETPSKEDPNAMIVVAFGVWQLPGGEVEEHRGGL